MMRFGLLLSSLLAMTAAAIPALAQPTISVLLPNSATAGGSDFPLLVLGTGIQPGAAVKWNGTPLSVTSWSANQVVATVTSALLASVGTASVTVENPNGDVSGAVAFRILSPPVIQSLEPNIAPANTTVTLTVAGSNFPNNAVVLFGGTTLYPTFNSPTLLVVTVPSSALSA
ncbi:MAG TPA: hypothetical protein DEH78_33445, partial [Solibacterales bacterium]|nr:hypothetical protein [Bryobacterales bacterium]